MSAYFELTVPEYAKLIGVSRQRVREWILDKRINFRNPAKGVFLIKRTEPRPKKERPWGIGNKFYCQR